VRQRWHDHATATPLHRRRPSSLIFIAALPHLDGSALAVTGGKWSGVATSLPTGNAVTIVTSPTIDYEAAGRAASDGSFAYHNDRLLTG